MKRQRHQKDLGAIIELGSRNYRRHDGPPGDAHALWGVESASGVDKDRLMKVALNTATPMSRKSRRRKQKWWRRQHLG